MIYYLAIGLAVAGAAALFGYVRWRKARVLARHEARRERHRARQQAWDEMVSGSPSPAEAAHPVS